MTDLIFFSVGAVGIVMLLVAARATERIIFAGAKAQRESAELNDKIAKLNQQQLISQARANLKAQLLEALKA